MKSLNASTTHPNRLAPTCTHTEAVPIYIVPRHGIGIELAVFFIVGLQERWFDDQGDKTTRQIRIIQTPEWTPTLYMVTCQGCSRRKFSMSSPHHDELSPCFVNSNTLTFMKNTSTSTADPGFKNNYPQFTPLTLMLHTLLLIGSTWPLLCKHILLLVVSFKINSTIMPRIMTYT